MFREAKEFAQGHPAKKQTSHKAQLAFDFMFYDHWKWIGGQLNHCPVRVKQMEVKYIWNMWGTSSLCYWKLPLLKKKKSGKYPGSLVVRIHSRIALPLFWPGFNPWLGNRDFEIHMVWSKFFFNFWIIINKKSIWDCTSVCVWLEETTCMALCEKPL